MIAANSSLRKPAHLRSITRRKQGITGKHRPRDWLRFMKSCSLLPYCPFPPVTGAKAVFFKHIDFLQSLGSCTILSAKKRPVGYGWTREAVGSLQTRGVEVRFVERTVRSFLPRCYGMLYAVLFKMLRAEKAFGHSNPYHRYAFERQWVYDQTTGYDLCEIHYSYWARLETACPKVIIIHDIWSDIMWEGNRRETEELATADLLVTVSYDDAEKLKKRGLQNVHWSPPCVASENHENSNQIALVGSVNAHNLEGLTWLLTGMNEKSLSVQIHCYGGICRQVKGDDRFVAHGYYENINEPYTECGIILMLTAEGTGVQIKGIEALAHGRAIIARKGAMRGLPTDEQAGWIEVDSPKEMMDTVTRMANDEAERKRAGEAARAYYERHLSKDRVLLNLRNAYEQLI